jgi:ecdysteroid 2-hydroxylase
MMNKDMKASEVGLLQKLKSKNLTEDMIARLLGDLLMAAVDTVSFEFEIFILINILTCSAKSAKSVQWNLHILAKDLSLQNKTRQSILENPTDFELPLVKATLREVLRMYPVAPFISRLVDSDVSLGEFKIPKGKSITLSQKKKRKRETF